MFSWSTSKSRNRKAPGQEGAPTNSDALDLQDVIPIVKPAEEGRESEINELALELKRKGMFLEAERLFRRKLEMVEQRHGRNQETRRDRPTPSGEHSSRSSSPVRIRDVPAAIAANNLALVLTAQGELNESKELFRRALTIAEGALGRHVWTAEVAGNMAACLDSRGELEGAEYLYRTAMEIKRQQLGEHHLQTAIATNSLATVLEALEEWDEASQELLLSRPAFRYVGKTKLHNLIYIITDDDSPSPHLLCITHVRSPWLLGFTPIFPHIIQGRGPL